MSNRDDILVNRAKDLRKNQTDAEKCLWHHLRNRRLLGYKFRRQEPMASNYIVDFVCIDKKLIIELDGGQHLEAIAYDKHRTEKLNSLGFHVLRYWNNDVLCRTDAVLQDIVQYLNPPHPDPLPQN
jgi:very-short-patch-repair endonuclease